MSVGGRWVMEEMKNVEKYRYPTKAEVEDIK